MSILSFKDFDTDYFIRKVYNHVIEIEKKNGADDEILNDKSYLIDLMIDEIDILVEKWISKNLK